MDDELFSPTHLKATLLDLLKDDKRELVWQLIDHYMTKAFNLKHYDVLGYVSLRAEKRDTYLKCTELSYALALDSQQKYNARINLYKAYNTMNRPEDALFYIEQNLLLNPDDFETNCQKAFNLSLMGNKKESEELLLKLKKQYPEKTTDFDAALSGIYLRQGNTAKGILSFVEQLKPRNKLYEDTLKLKKWEGQCIPEGILYIDSEGGLGDIIINIRFFENVKKLGMKPILMSPGGKYYKDINSVLTRHGTKIIYDAILIDKSQYWTPMLSLPGYLGVNEKDLWNGTYLTPLRNSKNRLSGDKFKIGIKCSGNPYFAQDEYRKIPLDIMLEYLPSDAEIYYIDKEPVNNSQVINLSSRIESWNDTLDFIDQMDVIVSSCTSLVHAAGAIGKTTFVAVPIAEYYIWTSSRTDNSTPWYGDNFYVMKQKKVRDWREPLQEIANALQDYRRKNEKKP